MALRIDLALICTLWHLHCHTSKQNDKEQTNKQKQTNDEQTTRNRIKNKNGDSFIQSNHFVALIEDSVASIIILLGITFNNRDPKRR